MTPLEQLLRAAAAQYQQYQSQQAQAARMQAMQQAAQRAWAEYINFINRNQNPMMPAPNQGVDVFNRFVQNNQGPANPPGMMPMTGPRRFGS